MTDFYALCRYPRSIDWPMVWLWSALVCLGLLEFGFAVYGFYHALVVFLHRVEGLL